VDKTLQHILEQVHGALRKQAQIADPLAVAAPATPTPKNTMSSSTEAAPAPVATPSAASETPEFDPSQVVSGAVSEYTTAPGTFLTGYGGLRDRLLQNQELKKHYARQLGEGATDEQIAQEAMQSYFQQSPRALDDLAARQAQLLRMSRGGPYQQQAQQALSRLPETMDPLTSAWSPEQWESYNTKVRQSIADPATLKALDLAGVDVIEEARKGVGEGTSEVAKDIERKTVEGVVENPNATGFTDWIKENWQTALIPAGLIAMTFGGNIGKVLGALAVGAGGYNLYERYNRLTNPKNKYHAPTLEAIQTAANQTDEQGNPAPFSDLEAAAEQIAERRGDEDLAPALRSTLHDYTFLAGHGFMDQIRKSMAQAPANLTSSLFGPGQQAQQPQQAAQPQNAAESAWQQAKDMARRSVGATDRFLVPGGRG